MILSQLQLIADAFQPLAKANGGQAQLCADPSDVFERMRQNPNGLWIYVDWKGDTEWNNQSDVTHVKRRSFVVILYRSRIAQVDPSKGVASPLGNLEASLALMRQSEEVIHDLRFVTGAGSDNDGDPMNVAQQLSSAPHFTWTGLEKQYYEDSFELTFSIATEA